MDKRTSKAKRHFTLEQLKAELAYDPETGFFTKARDCRQKKKGERVGSLMKIGYVEIYVFGDRILAHRLAWFYMTGKWPEKTIDHDDRNRANNSWTNLREATQSQQNANMKLSRKNKSGYRGVYYDETSKQRPWWTRIQIDGVMHPLGFFETPEEASSAYQAAYHAHFGEFARDYEAPNDAPQGHTYKADPEMVAKIMPLLRHGLGVEDVCVKVGISRNTFYRIKDVTPEIDAAMRELHPNRLRKETWRKARDKAA